MFTGCQGVVVESKIKQTISYSRLQTYLACPERFYFKYVLKLEEEKLAEALVFGKHLHYAVGEFYRFNQKFNEKMSLDTMKEMFDAGWKEEPFETIKFKEGHDPETLRDLAHRMLDVFHAETNPTKEIIAVEAEFKVPLIDIDTGEILPFDLVGTFDLVERDQETITLVELKSAARSMTDGQVAFSHQPSLYTYALWQLELAKDLDPVDVRYDVLTKTKTPKLQRLTASRDRKAVSKTISLVQQVMHAVNTEVFYRRNDYHCADCSFRNVCE